MPCTWSAWACVYHTASTLLTPAASNWRRSSGGVSTSTVPPSSSSNAPWRVRLSRASSEVQTSQSHPTTGTPKEGAGGSCPEECEFHESKAARHGGGWWKLPLGDL